LIHDAGPKRVAILLPGSGYTAQGPLVVGGGDLAGQFADAGLLNEIWVQFAPVTLGAGRPLLPRALDLELLDVARNRDFMCGRYRVRGS
jgi:dihydrofolate reductase